jgi:hypothetical protein
MTLWSSKPELGGSAARYAWMWGLLGAASLGSLMPAGWARGAACSLLAAAAYLLTPLGALGASFLVPACVVSALAFVLDTRLLAALVLSVGLAARPVQQMRGALEERNDAQLEGIEYVMSLTTPEDKVFTGWSGMGVFRRHAYYYYFLHPEVRAWMTIQEMTDGPLRALRTERPKLVEYDLHVRALPRPVQDYIRENYVPTRLDYVWIRRDAVDAVGVDGMSQR